MYYGGRTTEMDKDGNERARSCQTSDNFPIVITKYTLNRVPGVKIETLFTFEGKDLHKISNLIHNAVASDGRLRCDSWSLERTEDVLKSRKVSQERINEIVKRIKAFFGLKNHPQVAGRIIDRRQQYSDGWRRDKPIEVDDFDPFSRDPSPDKLSEDHPTK